MKAILLALSFLCCSTLYSQDSLRINQVNALVNTITHSGFPVQKDSILQDYPGIGLNMKTYITMATYGKELKRYAQVVITSKTENSITKQDTTGSSFYYDQDQLIKVEEFLTHDGKGFKAEWYYSGDHCFFYTFKSGKSEERVLFLLNLSKTFQKKAAGQN